MKTPHLTLIPELEVRLIELTMRGTVAVKTYRRAMALFALHRGACYADVTRQLPVRYGPGVGVPR